MKRVKWLGILLLCTAVLGGCADETTRDVIMEIQESALSAPQKTEAVRGAICDSLYYDAQVGPKVEQLTFPEEGMFGEFYVQLGDEVKEGDILAAPVLESIEKAIENKKKDIESIVRTYDYRKATLENSLAKAKLELENVYAKLEVMEHPSAEYTKTCTQAGEFDEQCRRLKLQLKQLKETYEHELPYHQKKLKELQTEREGNLIRAPFDGTIIALAEVEYGNRLDSNRDYVAVADTSVEYARCSNISITLLNQMERILFWKDGKEYEVVSVPMDHEYYLKTKNNGEDAYSEFVISDPNDEIHIGDFGKMVLIEEEKEDALLIPENTLQFFGGKYYVYKDVDGKLERVEVEIGIRDGISVEIIEGLEEGDVVYVQE